MGAKERPSFLKKRSKKLLHIQASALPERLGPGSQKFFGSFLKKNRFLAWDRFSGRAPRTGRAR
jgi:hypothetical protein